MSFYHMGVLWGTIYTKPKGRLWGAIHECKVWMSTCTSLHHFRHAPLLLANQHAPLLLANQHHYCMHFGCR